MWGRGEGWRSGQNQGKMVLGRTTTRMPGRREIMRSGRSARSRRKILTNLVRVGARARAKVRGRVWDRGRDRGRGRGMG